LIGASVAVGLVINLHASPTLNNKATKANNIRYCDFMIFSPFFHVAVLNIRIHQK
jgi:hypothetical protein